MAVVDRDEERGALALGVLRDHQREVELGGPLGGDRRAEVARGVVEEEGDALRRGELGRHDQVALVLAVLVVDHDEDLASGEGRRRRPRSCAKGMSGILPGEQALDVLGRDVDLEVHQVAGALVAEGGDLRGVGDDGDGEAVVAGRRPR